MASFTLSKVILGVYVGLALSTFDQSAETPLVRDLDYDIEDLEEAVASCFEECYVKPDVLDYYNITGNDTSFEFVLGELRKIKNTANSGSISVTKMTTGGWILLGIVILVCALGISCYACKKVANSSKGKQESASSASSSSAEESHRPTPTQNILAGPPIDRESRSRSRSRNRSRSRSRRRGRTQQHGKSRAQYRTKEWARRHQYSNTLTFLFFKTHTSIPNTDSYRTKISMVFLCFFLYRTSIYLFQRENAFFHRKIHLTHTELCHFQKHFYLP